MVPVAVILLVKLRLNWRELLWIFLLASIYFSIIIIIVIDCFQRTFFVYLGNIRFDCVIYECKDQGSFLLPSPKQLVLLGCGTCLITHADWRAAVGSMAVYQHGFCNLKNHLLELRRCCQKVGNMGPIYDHPMVFHWQTTGVNSLCLHLTLCCHIGEAAYRWGKKKSGVHLTSGDSVVVRFIP